MVVELFGDQMANLVPLCVDAGVVCRCDGVLCGSGSLSDEEDYDEPDESEEAFS